MRCYRHRTLGDGGLRSCWLLCEMDCTLLHDVWLLPAHFTINA